MPDPSVVDPYHHPVTSPAQPGYLPEQLPRDCHPVKHPQQFVTSAVIPLSTSEAQSEIFHARSIDKLYSCDTTKGTDELPELPKLLKDKESVNLATNRRKKRSPNLTCMVLLSLFLDRAQSLKNISQCLQKLLKLTNLSVNNLHFKRNVRIQMTLVP